MSLYQKVDDVLEVADFLNDTFLFLHGYVSMEQLQASYPLDSVEWQTWQDANQFWQDQYDAEPDPQLSSNIKGTMYRTFDIAYMAADRGRITEPQFLELIGAAPVAEARNRKIPIRGNQ